MRGNKQNSIPAIIRGDEIGVVSDDKKKEFVESISQGHSAGRNNFVAYGDRILWLKGIENPTESAVLSNDVMISRMLQILKDNGKAGFDIANYSYLIDENGEIQVASFFDPEMHSLSWSIRCVDDLAETLAISKKLLESGVGHYRPNIRYPNINLNPANGKIEVAEAEGAELINLSSFYSYIAVAVGLLKYPDHQPGNYLYKNNNFARLDFAQDSFSEGVVRNIRMLLNFSEEIEVGPAYDFMVVGFLNMLARENSTIIYDYSAKQHADIPSGYKAKLVKPLQVAKGMEEQFKEFCDTFEYIISDEYEELARNSIIELRDELERSACLPDKKKKACEHLNEELEELSESLKSSREFYNSYIKDLAHAQNFQRNQSSVSEKEVDQSVKSFVEENIAEDLAAKLQI